jgi:hypothetical protein
MWHFSKQGPLLWFHMQTWVTLSITSGGGADSLCPQMWGNRSADYPQSLLALSPPWRGIWMFLSPHLSQQLSRCSLGLLGPLRPFHTVHKIKAISCYRKTACLITLAPYQCAVWEFSRITRRGMTSSQGQRTRDVCFAFSVLISNRLNIDR